jgi:Tfp pilus assembly protein PilN
MNLRRRMNAQINVPWPWDTKGSGFNLLPWRPRRVAQARGQRLHEWSAALLLGLACAALPVGWQMWQQRSLDAARAAIVRSLAQLHAPLAEYSRLQRDAAARHQRLETAARQLRPLTHLLDLLDMLDTARAPGIALQQITHNAHETVLQATVDDPSSTDAWLARLRAVRDAQGVSVPELKRLTQPPRAARAANTSNTSNTSNTFSTSSLSSMPSTSDARAEARNSQASRITDAANEDALLQMTVHVLWKAMPESAFASASASAIPVAVATPGSRPLPGEQRNVNGK